MNNPSIPMRLYDWINKASASNSNIPGGSYLESAVDLAFMLTNRLDQIAVPQNNNGVTCIQLKDIVAENVIVFALHSLEYEGIPRIISVDILAGGAGPVQGMTGVFDQKSICHALGKILLFLFSKGSSHSVQLLQATNTQGPQLSAVALGASLPNNNDPNNDDLVLPPSGKRVSRNHSNQPSSQRAPTLSVAASTLLQDLGLPIALCRLVSDMLDAENDEFRSDTAFSSLHEVGVDLMQMRDRKDQFLFDQTCPAKALENTGLFQNGNDTLFGRESHLNTLMSALQRVSVRANLGSQYGPNGGHKFLCESVFVSGRSGTGKSALLAKVMQSCNEEEWFIINCKFDRQAAPLMSLFRALDASLENFTKDLASRSSLGNLMSQSILSSIDSNAIYQLCETVPNLTRLFPNMGTRPAEASGSPLATGEVGAGKNRLDYLFHILCKSMCLVRRLLFVLDDVQSADADTFAVVTTFVSTIEQTPIAPSIGSIGCGGGILLLGTFRDNETECDGFVMNQMAYLSQFVRLSLISTGELSKNQVNEMLSSKLCLPRRLTSSLANLAWQKTRGNPMFLVEFLKSIIANEMLKFSIRARRWKWEEDVIDLMSISNDVAQLLTEKLRLLPVPLIEVLKVITACGSQVQECTLQLLAQDQDSFHLEDSLALLSLAVDEGIVEKAGPIYAFSHNTLWSAVSNMIDEKALLHKKIGMSLLQRCGTLDSAHITLAADQMNLCKDDVVLSLDECVSVSMLQLLAGQTAMKASSFQQARQYFESGLSSLKNDDNHWESNYELSLELSEMSALASFMYGSGNDADAALQHLNSILQNARSFQDSLKASHLLTKFLGSRGNFSAAITHSLQILSNLGVSIPSRINSDLATSMALETKHMLEGIEKEQISQYPKMTDSTKLNAMKFMSLLKLYALAHQPTLIPVLSNQMMKLSLQFGFCEDSLLGLAMSGYSILNFCDDIVSSYRLGKMAELLIEEGPSTQKLKPRLVTIWYGHSRLFVEPIQSSVETFIELYNLSMLSGDIENAMYSRLFYCQMGMHRGSELGRIGTEYPVLIEQMAKYNHSAVWSAMSGYNACHMLLDPDAYEKETPLATIKSFEELRTIAIDTNNDHLMWHVDIDKMTVSFWFREYLTIDSISQKYRNSKSKRSFELLRKFYDGIASFTFARDTKDKNWLVIGEDCLKSWRAAMPLSPWNFENKLRLLEAEFNYTCGNFTEAEASYEYAILASRRHRFLHEEALAYELYGIYFCDRGQAVKSMENLKISVSKYEEWGALGKVANLKRFMKWIEPAYYKEMGISYEYRR